MKKNTLFNFIKDISDVDFDGDLTYVKKVNIKLINVICIINIITLFAALIPITIEGSSYTVISLLFLFNYFVPIFFNYRKEYQVAKVYLLFASLMLTSLLSFVFRRTGTEYFLLEFIFIVAIILLEIKYIIIYYILGLSIFIAYKYYDSITPFVPFPEYNYDMFTTLNLLIVATTVIFIVFYTRRLNYRILNNHDNVKAQLKA